jgi:tryptophan synthase alpha chain
MASRLATAFAQHSGSCGLIPYLTAGYPSLDDSLAMMRALERAGAMAIEVGIPFSDPIADGPDIQRASEWAVRRGVGAAESIELVKSYRQGGRTPVVLMTYANPILRHGVDGFAKSAREAGVDGVLVSDLPIDELPEVWAAFDREQIDTVVLIAPTSARERLPALLARCRGFVYCLARTGVTGGSAGESGRIEDRVAEIRTHTKLPIAIGFGISTAEHARAMRSQAEAIVVGAAFMRAVTEDTATGVVDRVTALARDLIGAL